MNKIKDVFRIKNISICNINRKDLSFKYGFRRFLKKINYISEYKENKQVLYVEDSTLNNSIINKIKRRGRNFNIKNTRDNIPEIYSSRKSWKHNSKRKHQFNNSI
jgi:hypothetical protein